MMEYHTRKAVYLGIAMFMLALPFTGQAVQAKESSLQPDEVEQTTTDEMVDQTGNTTSNGWEYSRLDDGTLQIDGYSGSSTRLAIPQTIAGSRVTVVGDSAFYDCSDLVSISIPDGITSIESSAFSNCSSLTSMNIPESVTYIGENAFEDCSRLTSINIPGEITSIEDGTFSDCSSLQSINIPAGVTYIGDNAFEGCSGLTGINIPDAVLNIGASAFDSCSRLTSIQIPDGVVRIGSYAFYDCSSLKSITIPESVTGIGDDAFNGCHGLTIHCNANSTAHNYAIENNIAFQLSSYLITFDANGGSVLVTTKKVVYGSTYGTLPNPTRTGYDFTGWYTSVNGETKVVSSSKVSNTNSHTLYAQWTPKRYTISYQANGGVAAGTSKIVTYGSAYGTLPIPTRSGYTFTGWYTAASGGSRITESTTVRSTNSHTLYAQWTPKRYTITYQASGGVAAGTSKIVTYGAAYGTLPTPTRTDYIFTGWYTSKNGGTRVTAATIMKQAENHSLYAHWKAAPPKQTTVKARLKTMRNIHLSWKKVKGAKGYEIYRATSQKGRYKKCKTVLSGSKTSYTDGNLPAGKTYYYKVRAYKTSGSKKVYGAYSIVAKKTVKGNLKTPQLDKPASFKKGKPLTLAWKTIKNADTIQIYCRKNGGKYKVLKTVKGKNVRATIPTDQFNFKRGNLYEFCIRAYYRTDDVKVYSKYSNSWAIGRR